MQNVSIVIATYNRQEDCIETLNSILNQTSDPAEIIVVDDASEPPFSFNHTKVKIIRNENELGLARSRTLAAKNAKGDIIAFIDDDALADSSLIEDIQKAFKKKTDIVGGRIIPFYLSKPPKWWNPNVYGVFVGINTGTEDLIGCNLAVRKSVFEKFGYFFACSRKGRKLFSGEENEFLKRVSKYCKIEFNKSIKVYHKVSGDRMTMTVLLKRAWYQGVSNRLIFDIDLLTFAKLMGGMILCLEKLFVSPKNARYYLLLFVKKLGHILPPSISVHGARKSGKWTGKELKNTVGAK